MCIANLVAKLCEIRFHVKLYISQILPFMFYIYNTYSGVSDSGSPLLVIFMRAVRRLVEMQS